MHAKVRNSSGGFVALTAWKDRKCEDDSPRRRPEDGGRRHKAAVKIFGAPGHRTPKSAFPDSGRGLAKVQCAPITSWDPQPKQKSVEQRAKGVRRQTWRRQLAFDLSSHKRFSMSQKQDGTKKEKMFKKWWEGEREGSFCHSSKEVFLKFRVGSTQNPLWRACLVLFST